MEKKNEISSEELYRERYRPQYHITPEKSWLNDPNGLLYDRGRYHVFYQYDPNTKFPGIDKWWAHVSSEDLVNWRREPVALSPDEFGSMWSGSAVVDEKNTSGLFSDTPEKRGLVAFYTVTAARQQQAMAYSKDGGITWIKYDGGRPVIPYTDDPFDSGDFRDPKVFWHEESGRWMMIVAGGPVRFYTSPDLIHWELESTNGDIHTECPDFFPMNIDGDPGRKKWVLSGGGVWYMLGEFAQVEGRWRFIPDSGERLPFGFAPDIYAGQSFFGTGDHRLMLWWMTDVGYAWDLGKITDPWSGALSLPYELTLRSGEEGLRIFSQPAAELVALRGKKAEISPCRILPGAPNPLEGLQEDCCEIEIELALDPGAGFTLDFRVGEGEKTSFSYDPDRRALVLDRSLSGRAPNERFLSAYPVSFTPEEGRVSFRLFLDWSSVEIFAEGGAYPFTALLFPDRKSCGMSLSAVGGGVTLRRFTLWRLRSFYGDSGRA